MKLASEINPSMKATVGPPLLYLNWVNNFDFQETWEIWQIRGEGNPMKCRDRVCNIRPWMTSSSHLKEAELSRKICNHREEKIFSFIFMLCFCNSQNQSMERLTISYFILLLFIFAFAADAGSIGVNFGRVANNLPSAVSVVQLLKSQGLERVKLYDTDPSVLKSLAGSGIKVVIDLPNEQLYVAAKRPSFAYTWVRKNIVAYYPATQIHAIAVGNEVFVDPNNTTEYLVPAMRNVQAALIKYNLASSIKVSSPIALSALQNSYPSSAGCCQVQRSSGSVCSACSVERVRELLDVNSSGGGTAGYGVADDGSVGFPEAAPPDMVLQTMVLQTMVQLALGRCGRWFSGEEEDETVTVGLF